jgi:Tfp pilus assembly protein FimT
MILMEIMVVGAIIAGVFAIALPSTRSLMGVDRQVAAKNLASTYRYLREEATLRNVVFRVAFDLDANTWTVQVGDPDTLIFYDQDTRESFEDELRGELRRYTQREIEAGEAEETVSRLQNFQDVADETLARLVEPPEMPEDGSEPEPSASVALPAGTVFAWVQTPQYDKPVEASDDPPKDDEPHSIAYAFIFPNGYAEPAFIRIVDEDDKDDGYTIEVEPLSGRVILHEEEVELDDVLGWLPEEGPELDR